jgi:general secretion pathway protein G
MKHAMKKGFTLVEILIVVIILGILAAIVIPQFTEASQEARISNLMTNLQTARSQLLLYKTQHQEKYPGKAGGETVADGSTSTFGTQMCQYSDNTGATSTKPDAAHTFGPYLQSVPTNPISGLNSITVVDDPATSFSAPAADGGWWLNRATGEFHADLTDAQKTADGTLMNKL